jgi:short-subunit dehydrogenase
MKIDGRVAIVTGASMGIGEATAKLLTEKGAKVALVARSKDKLTKLSKELKNSFVVVCDMSDPLQVKRMVRKVLGHYKRIDILVNNAGRGYDASIEDIKLNKLNQLFNLDLVGPLVAMQEVIPVMKKNKMGAIVNISSGTALMSLPGMSAYSSLKRALVGISLTAREELKPDGISVSVVYPYVILTNFDKNTIKNNPREKNGEDWINNLEPPADRPELVAEKIVEAIEKETAQVYAHTWMKRS